MSKELWENLAQIKKKKQEVKHNMNLTLDDEIEFIQDDMIKYFVKWALTTVPPVFWLASASKSGDYHPNFTHCEGGLIKHIKYGVRIAVELFKDPVITNFSQEQKDIIIASLILHDLGKVNLKNSKGIWYSYPSHGNIAKKHLEQSMIDSNDPILLKFKETDLWYMIGQCIKYHMGSWGHYKDGEPNYNAIMRFVHMCDYLASRKVIDYIENL